MDALYALPDLPTPLPPSPAAATTATTSTRRKRTVSPSEEAVEPAPKAKRVRSTAQEKAAKKSARMERNRIAAQVSRDRKKQQTEYLEQRVAELEAQLAAGPSPTATTLSTICPSPTFTLPALPPAPPTTADPLLVGQLREENESLKTQLALEKLASQALQIRLSSLEAKFGRLEQLLSGGGASGGSEVKPVVQVKQEEKAVVEQDVKESQLLMPAVSASLLFTEKDSSRLVAAEAVPPVLDVHDVHHPVSNNNLDHLPSPFDFTLPSSSGASSGGLQLDLNLDLALDLLPSSVAAPDPLLDQGLPDAGLVVSRDDLVQAWTDWANELDPSSFVQHHQQQPLQVDEQAGEEFDLFSEFLCQDEGVAGSAQQVEVGC